MTRQFYLSPEEKSKPVKKKEEKPSIIQQQQ